MTVNAVVPVGFWATIRPGAVLQNEVIRAADPIPAKDAPVRLQAARESYPTATAGGPPPSTHACPQTILPSLRQDRPRQRLRRWRSKSPLSSPIRSGVLLATMPPVPLANKSRLMLVSEPMA